MRLNLIERGLHARTRLRVHLGVEGLGVVTKGFRVLLQLFETTSNVETDVVIGHQAIGSEKVLQRSTVVAIAVAIGAKLKLQVRFVGQIVGARAGREQDGQTRESNRDGSVGPLGCAARARRRGSHRELALQPNVGGWWAGRGRGDGGTAQLRAAARARPVSSSGAGAAWGRFSVRPKAAEAGEPARQRARR